jgi:TRAP-type C4-dicarboxylate transport system permease small subunit
MTQQHRIAADEARSQDAPIPATRWQRLKQAGSLVSSLMFGCVFLIFAYKIVMRYLADDPVAWADEVSVVLFVWILFWGNAFVLEDERQIKFDLIYRKLPAGGRRAAAAIRSLVIGGLFLWALPGVIDYILFLWRERTPVLGWRLDYVYACFGIFIAAVVVRSVWHIVDLIRPGWRQHI